MKRLVSCLYTAHFLLVCSFLVFTPKAIAEERLISIVMPNSTPRTQDIHNNFLLNAKDFCDEGCVTYVQTPNADTMSLRNSIRKAIALGSDLIVTYGSMATLAAQAEVPPMPTLFVDVFDPVALGLVSKNSMTGNNLSGVRGDAPIQGLLKLLSDTVDIKKMIVVYDKRSPIALVQKQVVEESGKRKSYDVIPIGIDSQVVPIISLDDVDGIFVAYSDYTDLQLPSILEQAYIMKIPVVTQLPALAVHGAFMVVESSRLEQGEVLADMARAVLSGKNIKHLPMRKPNEISLVINLKIAKAFGIDVPIQTLSVASQVIH